MTELWPKASYLYTALTQGVPTTANIEMSPRKPYPAGSSAAVTGSGHLTYKCSPGQPGTDTDMGGRPSSLEWGILTLSPLPS